MINKLKSISLGNWIFIGMILGLVFGLILNFYVHDPFIKDVVLMNNVFYLGGNLFIKLMKMLVVPLVFCSIVVGVASLSDIKTLGSIGGTTIVIYIFTTVCAVAIALVVSMLIEPGIGLNIASSQNINVTVNDTMVDTVLNMVPDNPISSLANGDMLPTIIFAVLIGIILAKLKEKTQLINDFFNQGNKVMMEMTSMVLKFTPIGVFCLMAKTFGEIGLGGLLPLSKYILCILICLGIQTFIIYPSLLVIFTRLNPIKFFKRFTPVMMFAFSVSSSSPTIPLNMDKLSEMGVSREISSFTIPLGATINMDGTCIMQGVAVMFAAQAYGIDLGTSALLTVIFTAVIASIGTAPVPSVGLVTLTMVFNSVGLPIEAIGMIIGIDHIRNMFTAAVNITGDAICTIIVSFRNKAIDIARFNEKEPKKKSDITR